MRALHFSKGCYLGQEIVERIRSRGNVHRHLRQLELDGTGAGRRDGADVGRRNGGRADHAARPNCTWPQAARVFALGMIRAEAEAARTGPSPTLRERPDTGTARILAAPPSFARAIAIRRSYECELADGDGLETRTMSDTPKFEVIDRRKFKAEEEQESREAAQHAETTAGSRSPQPADRGPRPSGPRLVVSEGKSRSGARTPSELAASA